MAGGVGFYIKNDLSYTVCSDLTISKNDFEALWIEIANFRGSNLDLNSFVEYLSAWLERINRENKICLITGDFNIDQLKLDSHSISDKFFKCSQL